MGAHTHCYSPVPHCIWEDARFIILPYVHYKPQKAAVVLENRSETWPFADTSVSLNFAQTVLQPHKDDDKAILGYKISLKFQLVTSCICSQQYLQVSLDYVILPKAQCSLLLPISIKSWTIYSSKATFFEKTTKSVGAACSCACTCLHTMSQCQSWRIKYFCMYSSTLA